MVRQHVIGLLAVVAVVGVTAAEMSPREVLETARTLYAEEQYDSTIVLIKQFFERNGKHPLTEHLVPILMESLVRTNELHSVSRLYDIYRKKFPSSAYMPRMDYLNGVAAARQQQYTDAVESFSRALKGGVNGELDSLIGRNVILLCDQSLSAGDIGSLLRREDLHGHVLQALSYGLIRHYHAKRQFGRAEREAREFLSRYPSSRYAPVVSRIASSSGEQAGDYVPIGVLAPLNGYDADIGKRILQGLKLAVDEYNKNAPVKVRLVIRDTRSKPVLTAHKTYELLTETDVPVILGPILSQNAAVTAAMLVERDPVMLSPTATEDGIAELSPNIFQMNVTTGVLGRTIAEYAMTNLNINEFALLTPLSEYGRVLSEAFKAEVLRRGGTIVVEEFFDEGANDLRPQFTTIRYELLLRRKAKDSLRVAAGETLPHRTARDDSLLVSDSTLSVGGLFIPAEVDDVVMIAPQVAFFKVRTQMLGATGWHSPKAILDGKKYVENAIIVTNAETAREDTLWQAFRTRFQTRFGAEPDRVAALGYDAARLVCTVLQKLGRSVSPERLTEGLREVQGYRGVSGQISFDPVRGVNREAVILKISNRRFIRVR